MMSEASALLELFNPKQHSLTQQLAQPLETASAGVEAWPSWPQCAAVCEAEGCPIERVTLRDVSNFKTQFWKRELPVIITGMATRLGALKLSSRLHQTRFFAVRRRLTVGICCHWQCQSGSDEVGVGFW